MTAATESGPGFEWFPGIPSRNSFCYGRVGDVPVKVSLLTMIRVVMVEELGPDRMPLRTLMSVDTGGARLGAMASFLDSLGIRPGLEDPAGP